MNPLLKIHETMKILAWVGEARETNEDETKRNYAEAVARQTPLREFETDSRLTLSDAIAVGDDLTTFFQHRTDQEKMIACGILSEFDNDSVAAIVTKAFEKAPNNLDIQWGSWMLKLILFEQTPTESVEIYTVTNEAGGHNAGIAVTRCGPSRSSEESEEHMKIVMNSMQRFDCFDAAFRQPHYDSCSCGRPLCHAAFVAIAFSYHVGAEMPLDLRNFEISLKGVLSKSREPRFTATCDAQCCNEAGWSGLQFPAGVPNLENYNVYCFYVGKRCRNQETELERGAKRLKHELASERDRANYLQHTCTTLEERVREASDEKGRLNEDIREKENELVRAKTELDDKMLEAERLKQELEQNVEARTEEAKRLNDDMERLKENSRLKELELVQANKELEDRTEEAKKLNEEKERLNEDIREKENELARAKTELDAKTLEAERLKRELEQTVEARTEEAKRLNDDMERLKEYSRLKELELVQANKELEDRTEEAKKLNDEKERLNEDVREKENELARAKLALDAKTLEAERLKRELELNAEARTEEAKRLNDAMERLKENSRLKELELVQANKELEDRTEEAKKLNDEKERLNEDVREKENELARAKIALDAKTLEAELLKQELEQNVEARTEEAKRLNDDMERLKENSRLKELELVQANKELEDRTKEASDADWPGNGGREDDEDSTSVHQETGNKESDADWPDNGGREDDEDSTSEDDEDSTSVHQETGNKESDAYWPDNGGRCVHQDTGNNNEIEAAIRPGARGGVNPEIQDPVGELSSVMLSSDIIPAMRGRFVGEPPYGNTCPWCGEMLELGGRTDVDVLSDLSTFQAQNDPIGKVLRSHDRRKGSTCMFWGLRISRRLNNPIGTLRTQVFTLIRKFNLPKGKANAVFVTYADTGSKDALKAKIEQIFENARVNCRDVDTVRKLPAHDRIPKNIQETKQREFMIHAYCYYFEAEASEIQTHWRSDLLELLLGRIKRKVTSAIDRWPEDWNSDRLRAINDVNLSLFNYYYFWYASVFYSKLEMDSLIPVRDDDMLQMLGNKNDNGGLKDIRGPGGSVDVLGSHGVLAVPTQPVLSEAERELDKKLYYMYIGYSWLPRENNTSVKVPTKVLTTWPFWAAGHKQYGFGNAQASITGWRCPSTGPLCKGVVSLRYWCRMCRHVYCSARDIVPIVRQGTNKTELLCQFCIRHLDDTQKERNT